MEEPDAIEEAEGLRMSFGPAHDSNQVLDGIDLSLRRGDVLAHLPRGSLRTPYGRFGRTCPERARHGGGHRGVATALGLTRTNSR